MLDLDLGKVIDWVISRGMRRIAIQLPEGLKRRGIEVADTIREGTGSEVIIMGDPCYGACDLIADFKDHADGLVHFGHAPMPSLGDVEDVLFVEVRMGGDPIPIVDGILDTIGQRVGILATVQYLHLIPTIKDHLESTGRTVLVGRGGSRLAHPGQVLGCDHTAAMDVEGDVDEFLFIGEGNFHALAVYMATSKRVRVIDPATGEVRDLEAIRDAMLRQRFGAITRAMDAGSFLVVVSTKPGQGRPELADELVQEIRAAGRRAYIVRIEEVTPERLSAIGADAYVSTACPRIALDDYLRFERPIITPLELRIAIGNVEWEDYRFDSIA